MIKFISSYFCKHMYIDIHNFSYSEEMRGDFWLKNLLNSN